MFNTGYEYRIPNLDEDILSGKRRHPEFCLKLLHRSLAGLSVLGLVKLASATYQRSLRSSSNCKDLDAVGSDIQPYKTESGRLQVASPELAAWDLLRYPQASDGVNQIATVQTELGAKRQPNRLAALAPAFERETMQRPPLLLDRVGQHAPAYDPAPNMAVSKPSWVDLDPSDASRPDFAPEPLSCNPRWK
jgi:hypothetical protein